MFFLASALASAGFGASIYFDTSTTYAPNWWVTQPYYSSTSHTYTSGSTQGQAYSLPNTSLISITSNGKYNGQDRSVAGTLANFGGLWYADYTFSLPSNAYNISLSFNNLAGDDRVVLKLNGNVIGNESFDPTKRNGLLTDEYGNTNSFYWSQTTTGIINTASFFKVGGVNTIRLLMNNTGGSVPNNTSKTAYFNPLGTDATAAMVAGNVNYSLSGSGVPEPGTISLLLLGLVPLAYRLRSRC